MKVVRNSKFFFKKSPFLVNLPPVRSWGVIVFCKIFMRQRDHNFTYFRYRSFEVVPELLTIRFQGKYDSLKHFWSVRELIIWF